MTWLAAFVLTEVIEAPIVLLGLQGIEWSWPWRVAIALGPSALTHPLLWFVARGVLEPSLGYWGYVAVGEVAVVLAEGAYLWALEVPRPWLLALVANVASFSVGMLAWRLDVF